MSGELATLGGGGDTALSGEALPALPGATSVAAPQTAAEPIPRAAPRASLTRRQKAAIIVRLLLAEKVDLKLDSLPDEMQELLAVEMTRLRFVDRETLRAVVDEFVAEIEDIGLAFPTRIEAALDLLDGSISSATAARIRRQRGVRAAGDPWAFISGIDVERLLPVLEQESTEIAAVILSKLKVSTAAELLGKLPGKRAREITYAMSLTGAVSPDTVDKIGRSLAEQLDNQPARAFDDGPIERVGAILNFSPATTRDEVLEGLEQDDAGFASAVRKAIFTFANIPKRIDPRDVPKIIRRVDQAQLVTALAAATGPLEDAAEFILGAMSKRMAAQLREEIEALGHVKAADGEAAMTAVVSEIRELEAAGEILLLAEEEEE